jgi:hypothetical protein
MLHDTVEDLLKEHKHYMHKHSLTKNILGKDNHNSGPIRVEPETACCHMGVPRLADR